jgi:elongation factor Ts
MSNNLALIKKLRDSTGCGIADCNKALLENNSDFEKSVDWLRKKGLSSASKKTSRVASEGVVAVAVDGKKAVIIEVNSETDFVAKNPTFQEFVLSLSKTALTYNDFEKLKTNSDTNIKEQIAIIGENIQFRRMANLEVKNGVIVSYIHNQIAPQMGKIAVLVAIESSCNNLNALQELGKQISMHIAATKPDALNIESVNPAKLNREIDILKEQAKNSGKPASIIEKMLEGRIKKYYEEVVLLEQNFVMDDKLKIKDLLNSFSTQNNSKTTISDFKFFILGDGIEKVVNNFAEEVASMAKPQ